MPYVKLFRCLFAQTRHKGNLLSYFVLSAMLVYRGPTLTTQCKGLGFNYLMDRSIVTAVFFI